MVLLRDLVADLDALLDPERMPDYGPNGLQVEGRGEVRKLVTGVTASRNLIDAAIEADADAILVHHGLFWQGAWPHRIEGWLGDRIKRLVKADVSLIAYHLPLDVHPEFGNNAQIVKALGFDDGGRFGDQDLGFLGRAASGPQALDGFLIRAEEVFGDAAANAGRGIHLVRADDGRDAVGTLGVVSGAGHRWFESAVAAGCDVFISGEANESVTHVARETGTHFLWAGHHATERFGVRALGEHFAALKGLDVAFIDDPNPV